jgi:hypothetical protein
MVLVLAEVFVHIRRSYVLGCDWPKVMKRLLHICAFGTFVPVRWNRVQFIFIRVVKK